MACGDMIYRSTLPKSNELTITNLWVTPGVAPGFWDMFVITFVERILRPTYRKDDFVLGKKLGEGAFGTVYRVSLAKKGSSKSLLAPWRLLFTFVPPYQIAHGWVAFICSLIFISGIAFIVTKLSDLISCVTGINAYVIAFTALASGTSWPDLVASKISAERQITAESAIANITCRFWFRLGLGQRKWKLLYSDRGNTIYYF